MSEGNLTHKMAHGENIVASVAVYCEIQECAQVGQSIKLIKFLKQFILDVFDNPNGTSRACFSVARKNWKPALTAAVLLTHLLDAEPKQNRQIISGARSCD